MIKRKKCAKGIIDCCIERYDLKPWIKEKQIKVDEAIMELMDYLTAFLGGMWNFQIDIHPQEHFNKAYKGAAIFALMGNKLDGNGKPDLKIPGKLVKGTLKALLQVIKVNIPDELDDYLEFGDIDIYAKGVFFEEIKRKDSERLLKHWKKAHPINPPTTPA